MKKQQFYKLSGQVTPDAHRSIRIRGAHLDMTMPQTINTMALFVGKLFDGGLMENSELIGLWYDASKETEAVYGKPMGEIVPE